MGIDLLLNVVAIESNSTPDWSAAKRRIEAPELSDLDRFFTNWDSDGDLKAEAHQDSTYLENAKASLVDELTSFRKAIESTYRRDMTRFSLRDLTVFATGGLSAGAVPTELYDTISS